MITNLSLLKYVARQFKYRELPEVIGQQVTIQSIDTITSDLQPHLENTPFQNSELLAPERKSIEGTMLKSGRVIPGGSLFALALIDVQQQRAYPLSAAFALLRAPSKSLYLAKVLLNQMGYKLRAVEKTRPQKIPETDTIFAELAQVTAQVDAAA